MLKNLSKNGAIYLALITVFLYTCGLVHHDGFIMKLNLDKNLLERSFHQLVYNGFLILLNGIGAHLLIIALLLIILFILSFCWIKYEKLVTRAIILFSFAFPNKFGMTIFKAITFISSIFFYIFILYCFEIKGEKEAEKFFKDEHHKKIEILVENKPICITLLTCGARGCAGLDSNYFVHYFDFSSKIKFKASKDH